MEKNGDQLYRGSSRFRIASIVIYSGDGLARGAKCPLGNWTELYSKCSTMAHRDTQFFIARL